ncbi:MAG: NADH-quinone oxidoreductase subunit M, partial [Acidobacteria bacterium]|nr:NADH-quinone oxidoreductase subunit M [Acidobacteriota bacterium]
AEQHGQLEDLNGRELVMMLSLMAILLWLGIYPQPVLDTSAASMRAVQEVYSEAQATLLSGGH